MRKLVSAATSLVMAATMVSAVAPVVAGAADAKKGLSVLTYKDATLPSGVTADGANVTVSADAIKAGDVKVPVAIYMDSETPDVKAISCAVSVNSSSADVKNVKFTGYAPGDVYFDSEQTFKTSDGSEVTSDAVISFSGEYSKRAGFTPTGKTEISAKEKMDGYNVSTAYFAASWISSGSSYEWFGAKSSDYPLAVFDVTLPKGTAEGEYTLDFVNVSTATNNPLCLVETVDRYDAMDSNNLDLSSLTIKIGDASSSATTTSTTKAPDSTTTNTTTKEPNTSATTTSTDKKDDGENLDADYVFDFTNPDSEDGYWHANAGEPVDVDMHVSVAEGARKVTSFGAEIAVEGGITISDILTKSPAFGTTLLRDVSQKTASIACPSSDGHGIIPEDGGIAIMYTFDVPAGTPDGLYEISFVTADLREEYRIDEHTANTVPYDGGVGLKKGYIQVGDIATTTTSTTKKDDDTTTTTTKAPTTTTTTTSGNGGSATTTSTTKKDEGSTGTPVYGDTNCDGTVRINDVVLLNKYLNDAKSYNITAQGKLNADCYNPKNGDELTSEDSKAIIQSIVHLVELPVKQ